MISVRYSLCPNCDAWPEVAIAEQAVTIGEEGNQVRLSRDEWNVLVEGVKSGALSPTPIDATASGSCDCGCGCDCC